MAKGHYPDYLAYTVEEVGRERYWHRIGSAWANEDGKGISITLVALPLNGRLVLRVPKETGAEAESEAPSAVTAGDDDPRF